MLDFINQDHSRRGVLEHRDRGAFEFMESHRGRDVCVERPDYFPVEAPDQGHGRHLRSDNRSPSASALTRFHVVALELLEQHGLSGAADTVQEQARHSDARRCGEQFPQALESGVSRRIAHPAIARERGPAA